MLDHPWIILIAVAIGLLRWLSQKSDAAKEEAARQNSQESASPPPIPRDDSQTEEERIRRFLEALGQPKGSTPPPKVAPKQRTQPRIFPTLPPLTAVPPPLPATAAQAMRVPPPPVIQSRIFTPAIVQETSFEVRDIGASAPSDVSTENLRPAALASMQGLRSAIVLREIFGPPRSLQPLDPISGF